MSSPFTAIGRNGVKITEDAPNSRAYVESGPVTVETDMGEATLAAVDNGKLITNEDEDGDAADRAKTLFSAAAIGSCVRFYDRTGDGLRIVAPAGQTITVNGMTTKAGGYVQSTNSGQFLTLWKINATEWVAEFTADNWEVETE